jgi:hypothetical protein
MNSEMIDWGKVQWGSVAQWASAIATTVTGKWFEEKERMLQDGVMMRVVTETSW